jgi:hypothetical protein
MGQPPWTANAVKETTTIEASEIKSNVQQDVVDEIKGKERDLGGAGLFSEYGWLRQKSSQQYSDISHKDWLRQVYLLTLAKQEVGVSDMQIPFEEGGGRGGAGPVLQKPIGTQISDKADYEGGDGGATLVLMAPTVIVDRDATIDLRGSTPDITNNDRVLVPGERGMSGKFGVIAATNTTDVDMSGIETHAQMTPAMITPIENG